MRYAVFSDVHSNLEAFEAVLEAAHKSHIDQYLFLGDIVGYGANPCECIAHLRKLCPLIVAGNHDWGVVGMTDLDYFNEEARASLVWTKEAIAEADRIFLSQLKLVQESVRFCIVHGTLSHPEEFDYMTDGQRAAKTFYLLEQEVCFVGHSHRPGVFVDDTEKIYYQVPKRLDIVKGRRYIVNDGSIGQPRDGDWRACFCIYDDNASTIEFRRVEYNIHEAQKKILEAGLPRILADRLSIGR
ncbi:MAG: metallophosphoesterase family protein [Candidatus Omnitrophica bacterium]|nr:metallophosphoesterase family protein [Candidatus Omnitrophota bacterium]